MLENTSLEGEALAYDSRARSVKAKKQTRDRFGRWVSVGASVRWRDNNGQDQAGTVTDVTNGQATIKQRNPDGSFHNSVMPTSSVRVLASKATLPDPTNRFYDKNNNFSAALKNPEYQKMLNDSGHASIQRADGFMLDATKSDQQKEDTGNPVLYQLFAPGGASLGKYDYQAEDQFDSMVAEYQADNPAPSGDAPAAPAGGVVASGEEKPYRVPEKVKTEIFNTLTEFSSKMNPNDVEVATRLAYESTVSMSDVEWIHSYFSSNEYEERLRGGFNGRKWAAKIVGPTEASVEDVPLAPDEQDGIDQGRYFFDGDTFVYFAVGAEEGSSLVYGLLAVDYETGAVYEWGDDGFELMPDLDMALIEAPQITPIDDMTAEEFAKWLDAQAEESDDDFDLWDVDPEERNLFSLAQSELDFEEMDRAYAIIADGLGYNDYSREERSINAKRQGRQAGGRFGATPDKPKPKPAAPATSAHPTTDPTGSQETKKPVEADPQGGQDSGPKEVKAKLPQELPLLADPAARINEFMQTAQEAPVLAAGEPQAAPEATDTVPATSTTPSGSQGGSGPTDEAIYFAIVDPVDKTAVLDAVSIVKQNGQPAVYKRENGQWVAAPDMLAQLTGTTPPAVAEMAIPEPAKTVLQQIDDHDAGKDTTEPEQIDPNEPVITAAGFALFDGSLPIFTVADLQKAVVASVGTKDTFVKAHIRKRARALNRMDLVPSEWRTPSLAERGELEAAETLYGEYGEIIPVVAGGVPGIADTPGDLKNTRKLKNYWKYGKGALKIRWGTPGDLTRAHRHLAKYVGPDRAWGLAQNLHKELFGVSNITHDRATGQYVPRRRKKH